MKIIEQQTVRCCPCPECQLQPTGKLAEQHRAINRMVASLNFERTEPTAGRGFLGTALRSGWYRTRGSNYGPESGYYSAGTTGTGTAHTSPGFTHPSTRWWAKAGRKKKARRFLWPWKTCCGIASPETRCPG